MGLMYHKWYILLRGDYISVVLAKGIVQNIKVFDKQEKKFNDKDFDLIESILRKYINLDNYCIKKEDDFIEFYLEEEFINENLNEYLIEGK